ncbi:hypothetical protein BH09GEM1_BH09GEM1_07400 [soil metagenome]
MAVALAPTSMSDLDYLLGEIAESLQLDATHHERMRDSYEAVCRWLSAPESPVGSYRPTMYAQGSAAIGTTVKPKRDDEFDLDFVLQVERWTGSPMDLYDAVYRRLNEHGVYSPKLKLMRRCVRIEYAGQFHLDIVPAALVASPTPTSILITDSATQSWTSSNPKGFARWFLTQARSSLMKAERKIEPLPKPLSVEEKEVLALAVQLMKRHRDEFFANEQNEDRIPRSIVLTTLAGTTTVVNRARQKPSAISACASRRRSSRRLRARSPFPTPRTRMKISASRSTRRPMATATFSGTFALCVPIWMSCWRRSSGWTRRGRNWPRCSARHPLVGPWGC